MKRLFKQAIAIVLALCFTLAFAGCAKGGGDDKSASNGSAVSGTSGAGNSADGSSSAGGSSNSTGSAAGGSDSSQGGGSVDMTAEKWVETINRLFSLDNYTAVEGEDMQASVLYNGKPFTAETDLSGAPIKGLPEETQAQLISLLLTAGEQLSSSSTYTYVADFANDKINWTYQSSYGSNNTTWARIEDDWIKEIYGSSSGYGRVDYYGSYGSNAEAKKAFRYYSSIANSFAATPVVMKKDRKEVQIWDAFEYFTKNADGNYEAEIYLPEGMTSDDENLFAKAIVTVRSDDTYRLELLTEVEAALAEYLSYVYPDPETVEQMAPMLEGFTIKNRINYYDTIDHIGTTAVPDDFDAAALSGYYTSDNFVVHTENDFKSAFEDFTLEKGYHTSFTLDGATPTTSVDHSVTVKGNATSAAAYDKMRESGRDVSDAYSGYYYVAKDGKLTTYKATYNNDGKDDDDKHITAMDIVGSPENIPQGTSAMDAVLAKLPEQASYLNNLYSGKKLTELYSSFHYECDELCATLNDGEKDVDIIIGIQGSKNSYSEQPTHKDDSDVRYYLSYIRVDGVFANFLSSTYDLEVLNPETFVPYVPYGEENFSQSINKLKTLDGVTKLSGYFIGESDHFSIEADFENNMLKVHGTKGGEEFNSIYVVEDTVLAAYTNLNGEWQREEIPLNGAEPAQMLKTAAIGLIIGNQFTEHSLGWYVDNATADDRQGGKIVGLDNMYNIAQWINSTFCYVYTATELGAVSAEFEFDAVNHVVTHLVARLSLNFSFYFNEEAQNMDYLASEVESARQEYQAQQQNG